MNVVRVALVLSINMCLSIFAFGARVSLDKQLVMRADDFYEEGGEGHAELITWLNTTHTVGWDANEHLALGDTAWRDFISEAWGAMRTWSEDSELGGSCTDLKEGEAACAVTPSGERRRIRESVFQGITETLQVGKDNKGYLTFGDYLFLSGDFFADDKNDGNLEDPVGVDFLQTHPMQPLQDIVGNHTATEGQSGWSVTLLVSQVRNLVNFGAEYDGGAFAPFVERQAKFMTLTGGRYAELAFANHNHFGVMAKREYMRYHSMAVEEAFAAGTDRNSDAFLRAFEIEAMGAHYLTDLFSAGHVRVPRTQLQAICTNEKAGGLFGGTSMESAMPGGVPVAGFLTKMMHDEESQLGVVLEGVGKGKWNSYGDSTWFKSWSELNKEKANEAVVHGLNGLLYAFLDGLAEKAKPETHDMLIPYPAHRQPTAPLFKVSRTPKHLKAPHAIALLMRISEPTAKEPQYILLDEDCVGTSVPRDSCITCKDAIPLAENAKAAARAVSAERGP